MSHEPRHLSSERLQALLDGSLPEGEVPRVREHLSSCARCRSELEAWQVLFHELGELGELAPSTSFGDRVMDAVTLPEPERLPLAARVGRRVRGWLGSEATPTDGHLSAAALQELLDEAVTAPRAAAMESHLDGCRGCREEMRSWHRLLSELDGLDRLAPAPAFSERVMAHVRVQAAAAVAKPSFGERVQAWIGGIDARTRKRAAALAGAAVTPAVTLALVAYVVFSHPMVTVSSLVSFTWLKAQGLLAAASSTLASRLGESVLLGEVQTALEMLTRTPAVAALVVALFGGMTLVAAWVLYRNLVATNPVDGRYAHFSF